MEIGRRHFQVGSQHYVNGDYQKALEEFQVARRAKPLPALDYNIGRCEDRLEHYSNAIAAYERYLASKPNNADVAEVEARIGVLKGRLAVPVAVVTTGPTSSTDQRSKRRKALGIGIGIGATVLVAGLAIGLGVGLSQQSNSAPTVVAKW